MEQLLERRKFEEANRKAWMAEKRVFEDKITSLVKDNELLLSEKMQMRVKYDEMFAKLTQSESDLAAALLRITDFELSSKIMKVIVKSQIHGKLKHGLGYSEVPPPYNSNYTIMPDSLTGESKYTDMVLYESSSASPVLAKSGSSAPTSTNISFLMFDP